MIDEKKLEEASNRLNQLLVEHPNFSPVEREVIQEAILIIDKMLNAPGKPTPSEIFSNRTKLAYYLIKIVETIRDMV